MLVGFAAPATLTAAVLRHPPPGAPRGGGARRHRRGRAAGPARAQPLPELPGPAPARPRPGLAGDRRPAARPGPRRPSRSPRPPRWPAAAFAAAEVLAHIDGGRRPRSAPRSRSPGPAESVRRSWTPHPRGCRVPARSDAVHKRCGSRGQDPRREPPVVFQLSRVTDIPRSAVGRTARLAALPLGFAGRAALGLGKRVTGMASDVISAEVQQRTAEQLFSVLGQLKGGAMKLGQALSVFEAALPEELAGPYRAALTKLQEAAPPLPAASVHKVLAEPSSGRAGGSGSASSTTRRPPRRASARCTGRSGRTAATVAGQGPVPGRRRGAARRPRPAVPAGRRCSGSSSPGWTSSRWSPSCAPGSPRSSTTSWRRRRRRAFAKAYAGDDEILRPAGGRRRAAGAGHRVGRRHAAVAGDHPSGTPDERDLAGLRLATLHFSAPARAGLLHADPHPGNFRLLADGRLGVLDFGAVARLPGGHPEPVGRLTRLALAGRADEVLARAARRRASSRGDVEVDAEAVLGLRPPDAGADRGRRVPVHPGLAARRGGPRGQPAQPGLPARPQPQPAAVVPA